MEAEGGKYTAGVYSEIIFFGCLQIIHCGHVLSFHLNV